MHIAVDAREMCGRQTGVGRYLAHLLDAWGNLPEARQHRFTLYAPSAIDLDAQAPHARSLDLTTVIVPGPPGTWWEQVRLASATRRARPDVLFAPAYTAPLFAGVPIVLTVHDISFEAHPEWFRWREGLRQRRLTRASVARARRVLTDSEFSKREMVERLGTAADRIRVIRLGAPRREPPAKTRVENLRREPTVLYVGSIFNRRRLPDLIAAFSELVRTRPDVRLDIVGENRTYPPQDLLVEVDRRGLRERVAVHAYVSDGELARLYGEARVFAFLSEYEGFGLTPLEALAAGVPVVVLDTPIAREMYGDAAVYVGLGDISGTAATLASMIDESEARRHALAQAPVVLGRFSWSDAARQTLEALTEPEPRNQEPRNPGTSR